MRRFSPRFPLALPLLVVAIFAVAGCESPVIRSDSASQPDLIGPVRITTVVEACDNGNPTNNQNCPASDFYQLLAGYRVPEAADTPGSFPSASGPATTFRSSSSYTSELQRLAPAPAGEKWVGYISDKLNLAATTTDPDRITLAPDFDMPQGAAGSPFPFRTVVGMRDDSTLTNGTRPVVCDATNLIGTSSDSGSTDCVSTPSSLPTLESDLTSSPLNDLALAAGPAPTAHPGDTVSVPFVATLTGPSITSGSFALSAISTLAGATSTPATPTFAPATGATATAASVKVPLSAAPGDYPVTLTATHGNQSRSATGTVHVLAVPGLVIAFKAHSLNVSRSGSVTLPISCPAASIDPCAGTVTLGTAGKVLIAKRHTARKRALRLGSGKFTLAPGANGTVKVKISTLGRKALARTGRLAAKATFVMANRAGQKSTIVKRLTLHAPKARQKHRRK